MANQNRNRIGDYERTRSFGALIIRIGLGGGSLLHL